MKTIAVINQRGGVGKTTTALSIYAGLRRAGYTALFVDMDAQGSSSYTLRASSEGYGLMGVLERPETASEEIQHTSQADIIPSSYNLTLADKVLDGTGKEYRLKEALETVQEQYEYTVIDTPPFLGVLTVNALTACTGAIIPAQADVYSLQGIAQLSKTISSVQKYCNPSLQVLGIVLTRYSGRAIVTRDLTEMIKKTAAQLGMSVYETKIRECTALKEAQARREDIFTYAPRSNAAIDYTALMSEILGGENK